MDKYTQYSIRCVNCQGSISVPLLDSEVAAWNSGMLIQDAMPSVSPEIREMLVSGLCPDCWDALFEDED